MLTASQRSNTLESVRTTIENFQFEDLCKKAGAIQLVRENADYFAEMIRCSALVAMLPESTGGPFKMSDLDFAHWVNEPARMDGPEYGGDPHEGLYVAEIPYHGGGYLVMPVESAGDDFILECLLEAVAKALEDSEFKDWVKQVAVLGLTISDLCIQRSGLNRQSQPGHSDDGEIQWPRGGFATQLKNSVTFNLEELLGYLGSTGLNVGLAGLDALAFEKGTLPNEYVSLRENPVCSRPILKTEKELIVVSPMTIANAIRDAIVRHAESTGKLDALVEAYQMVVASRVDDYAKLMGWEKRNHERIVLGEIVIFKSVFLVDSNKAMVTYVVTDRLTHGERKPSNLVWDTEPATQAVLKCIELYNDAMPSNLKDKTELVHCLLTQGIGRWFSFDVPEVKLENASFAWCAVDELYVFTMLNPNDPLAMWRVVKSFNRITEGTAILVSGFLDHYALYRSESESYYFGDDGRPDALFMQGAGMPLRLEAAEIADPHYVSAPDGNTATRVYRIQDKPDFNIYASQPDSESEPELFVENLPRPVWVRACSNGNKNRDHQEVLFRLVDAVAFWVWQLTPEINQRFEAKQTNRVASIIVAAKDSFLDGISELSPRTSGVEVTNQDESCIHLSFNGDFGSLSNRTTNEAEIGLARVLLHELFQLFDLEVDADEHDAIIATHAKSEFKRRMATVDGASAAILDTRGLPAWSNVLSFDEQIIQDELAEELAIAGAINEGRLPNEKRKVVLNKAVGMMYEALECEIAELNCKQLLLQLVGRQESLIAARRQVERSTNSELACFGDTQENRRELQLALADIDKASIASRFLIEYVAARPPKGQQPFSQAGYNRLLALAASIFKTSQLSDALQYNVAEHTIELLKSGRMMIRDDNYESVMARFHRRRFSTTLEAGVPEREQRRKPVSESDSDAERAKLDGAAKAEFGFSISEIGRFLNAIIASPFTRQPSDVGLCKVSELKQYLVQSLSLTNEDFEGLLSLTSLVGRKDYLKPPKPFSVYDVYPWVFNRRLSYLRRPIVLFGEDAIWGSRAIFQAANYTIQICMEGRVVDPQSMEMKVYQGNVSDKLGDLFNIKAADVVKADGRFVVRAKIESFNGKLVSRENGDKIGDVDVLVADTERKKLFPIETKCFTFAKTASAVGRERDNLFGDVKNSTGKIGKHVERIDWIQAHLSDVLSEIGVSDINEWEIVLLIVLDVDLISAHLFESPIEITTLSNLIQTLDRP